nr:MAG TPA: D12 class N6 adenine-specific DNA methyltransferase [Caudoviricetes sp.]
MRYGVPYRGSKNKIADWVVDHLPDGKTLVDLFAGGCAVTHAAILAGKWENFIINDLGDAPEVFENAINGKYANEKRWISREDFYRLKDTEPYVSLCWSFGNNRSDYLYSEEVEPWKRALHHARVLVDASLLLEYGIDSDGSAADVLSHHDEYKEKYIRWWFRQKYTITDIDALIENNKQKINEEKERLRGYLLKGLKSSGMTQADVQKRLGTQMSGHYFGRSQWVFPTQEYYEKMQRFMPALDEDYNQIMVIVSEYNAPKGCTEIASKKKQPIMGMGNKGGTNTEKLFVQDRFYERYKYAMNYQIEMEA